MAVRKRPSETPPAPGAGQGIAGVQASPFAITGSQVIAETGPRGGVYGEYDSAKAELDSITELLARADAARAEFGAGGLGQAPKETVIFNEKVLNLQQFDKEVAGLKKNLAAAKKRFAAAEKIVKPLQDRVEKIKDQIDGAGDDAARRAKWEKQLPDAEAKLAKAKELPVGTKMSAPDIKKVVSQPPTTKPPAKGVSKPAAGKETTSAADVRRFEETGVTTPTTTPQPGTTTGGGPTTGGGGTAGGGQAPASGGKGGKGKKPKVAPDWASIVQQEFGSLWDVYNGNADVKAVLDQAVKEGWYNDETKLSAQLQNTGWYRTTERSARQFAIRNSTDPASVEDEIVTGMEDLRQSALANGFTFDDMTLRRLSTDKIKYGWSAQQTTSAIGSEAVAQAQGRGAQGLSDLRSGFVGQQLRKIAKSYAQKPSETQLDSFINDIMTGKKTTQQFTDAMRNSAKTMFRSLAPAIDQGQDVETAMYAYQQAAQSTLGNVIDTSTIDWTSDKWNKALNFRDEKTGEYRQMDLWEWNKYLRKLPEWQQTDEAKQTYQNVAYALAQGFGKIA